MPDLFEPVHAVEDYYDGPRTGVADYRGVAHRFRSLGWQSPDGPDTSWNPTDDRYELVPLATADAAPVVAHGKFRVRPSVTVPLRGTVRLLDVCWVPVAAPGKEE